MILEDIVSSNEPPVLVIGSGLTQRYYKNAFCWGALLLEIAAEIGLQEDEFYRTLASFCSEGSEIDRDSETNKFRGYKKMATYLQEEFNKQYYQGKKHLENYNSKRIYDENLSPMKVFISKLMKDLTFKEGFEKEREAFSQLLLKCHSIFTTNYDTMVEDLTQ
jgi:hypothetical protein